MPLNTKNPHISVTNTASDIPQEEWDRLFGEDVIEGWGYHKAFEESGIPEFRLSYILAKQNGKLAAIIPFFTTDFSFATIIQGKLQKTILRLQKRFPRFLRMRLLFIGLPTAEELYIGIAKDIEKKPLYESMLLKIKALAKNDRARGVIFYNLSEKHADLARYLGAKGFACMANYPNTQIEINAASLEEYINCLSKNTRKDIKRKLRDSSQKAALQTKITENIENVKDDIYKLYMTNFSESNVSFETLTPDFFTNISRHMKGRAKFFLTYDKDKLVAFNLCLTKGNICIDKFIGFNRQLYRDYSLYHATFCHNIDWCIKNGFRFYQMGITDYHPKIRLGAKLLPLQAYFLCSNPLLRLISKPLAKIISPVNFDPTLRKLKNTLS